MNVNSVNISQMLQTSSSSSSTSTLTTTQLALIEDTLAQYDVDNLSEDDAKAIVKTFTEAGITPSYALQSAMAVAGFDAKDVGTLAGVGASEGGGRPAGGPPPPPSDEELTTVEELLESLLYAEDDEDDTSANSSFASIMDYTNKIVRLNDDAKTDLMEILNTYNSEENTLSQEDTQAFILNSLREVLNNSDNYNTVSFYA